VVWDSIIVTQPAYNGAVFVMSTEGLARYILEKRAADPDLVVVVQKDPALAPHVRRKPRPTARQEEARACMPVGLRGALLGGRPA